jgi:hypothetical protein
MSNSIITQQNEAITATGLSPITNTSGTVTATEESSLTTYIIIGVVIVVLAIVIYWAYGSFTEQQSGRDSDKSKDKCADGFDLRDAIKDLEKLQKKICSKLSSDTGI